VVRGLTQLGLKPEEAKDLAGRPARDLLEVVSHRPARRGFPTAWFERVVQQLEELRNLYVEGALYIVLGSVNRYRGLGVDTADLIQEGNASMFQAIDGFDWRRDVRFRTYAQYWVHQAILKMLYNSSRTVRVPIWVQKILGKIRRAQDALRRSNGREPTHDEIGRHIGVAAEKVAWVLATRRYAVSLDAEIGGEEGSSLVQRLADESLQPVPDSVPVGDLPAALRAVMADLPERERLILQARFGLGGKEPQTLSEIADGLGVTAERVRQLQNAALARIKRPGKLRQLQAFVE
jgi:RNA polymerase primary sigma factor